MRKRMVAILLSLSMLFLMACAAHIHTIGRGPKTGATEHARQWYFVWGLVPINTVSTNAMAGGAADYEIRTEQSPEDIIISLFTNFASINCRTVTVKR